MNDFIIQIIGGAECGKTTLATKLTEFLQFEMGMVVENNNQMRQEDDKKNIKGKRVFITEFRAVNDPDVKNSEI
jgi:uridine kinase